MHTEAASHKTPLLTACSKMVHKSDERSIEKKQALLQMQSNDHLALRRLYHVVKNVLVGVAGVLEQPEELTDDDRVACASSLRHGIDFILHRTAFSALAAGNYTPQKQRVVLETFFSTLAVPPSVERRPKSGVHALAASFETLLMRCALVDTISNALSHGVGGARVEYWVQPLSWKSSPKVPMLHVGVYNWPKPDAPALTDERITELFEDGTTHGGGGDNSGMGLASVRFMLQVILQYQCTGKTPRATFSQPSDARLSCLNHSSCQRTHPR